MVAAASVIGVAILLGADAGVRSPMPRLELVRPAIDPFVTREQTYDLRPAKDGSGDLVYEGSTFTARVARDGTARFVDKGGGFARGMSLIPFVPLPMPSGTPSLQGVVVDLFKRRPPPRRPSDVPPPDPPLPVPNMSRYRPDPNEVCRYPSPCFFHGRPMLSKVTGNFDLTDELMLMNGEDPYRRDKALFLASTREVRAGMAARALAADVRRAAGQLAVSLRTIACDDARSPAERRAIIEALRAELDGDTEAAREAVATIARFVAAHFDADGGASCAPH